ncbi:MAG: aminoglycoside phosphotransferase family protein [Alphaproteobacteria bacterium]|nr:aminoglycoside phosphotransferase family protein [Alphaproteobacteria bacterium]
MSGDDIRDIAAALAGAPVTAVTAANAGGNSRIFRVSTASGTFALKAYPARAGDPRARAETEWHTLGFLAERGLTAVPRPLARDASGRFLLMEWAEGEPVIAHGAADLREAADFVAAVFALSADPAAGAFPLASEACLSAAEIVRQLDRRLPLLAPPPPVARFLEDSYRPLLARQREAAAARADYAIDLAAARRRLIPADFGFHNALRQAGGALRFVDFEYFGWDDPVKLTADFLLHPAMRLSAGDRRFFVGRMQTALADDDDFPARLRRLLPLFALRWMLILFNPFRADRTADPRRQPDDSDPLVPDRLAKARAVLPWAAGDEAAF